MAGLAADSPTPTAITVRSKSRLLDITFSDGVQFTIAFELMRVCSPSAEVQGHGPGQEVLQVGKREIGIAELAPVGNYAVKPVFTDGHESGIFSWDYLYHLGANQDRLWADYKRRLAMAGMSRDNPPKDCAGTDTGSF